MDNKDIFTSLVRIKSDQNYKVVSVKSNIPIEKVFMERIFKGS